MKCQEFQTALHPYVDGELGVNETLAADAHTLECVRCQNLAERERQFRQLLRGQPGESAPAELRARIVTRVRQSARVAALRPWLLVPFAVAAVLVGVVVLPGARQSAPFVGELVDKHIAYAQIERPAEFASADQREVEAWFRERADLKVTVPDYSPSGIRLVGARIAVARQRRAAYVLYEKGHTLLSVFMVPASGRETELGGKRVAYRGQDYLTREWKGYRTVSWTDGRAIFGLVSMLDYEALIECADRLRVERASQTPL